MKISVIIPAKNEDAHIGVLVKEIFGLDFDKEVIVVDDGSIDQTAMVARQAGAKVISHPYCLGNGAAIRTGARNASGAIFVFMDADGQHKPSDIASLLAKIDQGFTMAVGARGRIGGQANIFRAAANYLYNRLSSWMVGHRILDLTSGFRAVRADVFKRVLYLLPNGFSYPTTVTMSLFRLGYSVAYVPIEVMARVGKSHINIIKDGAKFFLIIVKIGALYSPLRIFAPASLFFFMLAISHYAYNFVHYHRFTNMSLLLFVTSIVVFLVGLLSEQITTLMYKES